MVLNVSEMEAKVQEATNNEPWYDLLFHPGPCLLIFRDRGASSTLMGEIAQGYVATIVFIQFINLS